MADFFEDEESFVPGSSAEDYVDAGAEQEPTAIDTFSGNTGSDDFATMPEPSPQRRVVDIAPTPPKKPRLSGNPESLEEDMARVDDWVERTHQWEAREEAKVQKAEFEKSRRAHNAQARQISAATGAQFNYDADGVAQPRVNPQTGEQAFTKRTSPVRWDEQGRPFQVIQNEQGTQSERIADPDASADIGPNPEDPEDKFIYRKTKFQPWEAIDPEEGINSTDGRVVRASGKALFDREKTTLKRERDEISLSLRDPARPRRLSPEARQQVEAELQGLSQAAPPPAQVKGMFGGVNVEATEAAKQKWQEGEAFRSGLLAEKQSLLAADDERAGLETRAYELDQNLFGLEKMPLSQFVQDRRQKKAQSLADLAPEAARAEMENRGAAIAEEDASTESAMQDLQRRSAALNERTKKGITIQELESVAAERAAIEADAQAIDERVARRNAAAGEMMRGMEAIKAKENSKREESFAELDRQAAKYPELAEDAKAFRSVDADYRNRMAAVQEQPEGPGKQAAVDALNSEFQTKRKETGSAYVSKLEKRISGDVGAAIEKVAGPGGALGFKSQIAALEKDAEIDPDIKKIAVEVIRNQAVDALIRSNNLAAVKPAVNRPEGQDFSDAYKAAGYLNPENPEDRAKAAQILEQDPGLGAKLFDGFDRAMSTFGARIFGAVSVVGKAISYRLGLDPDNAFREASEAGYQVKLDAEKYREKFRDPRLETDDALNRWIMPAVSEALPNLAGMALTAIPAVGPALAVTYNIGQLYDEAYSQASQDASLTEDQKHNAASIYAALALPAETIGDIASGGIFTSRMIPKAAKRQSVEAAAKFWSKFTNVGEVWDKLPPILKRGVAIVAAGGIEGLTETAQDKILNATIETIKTGNIGDSVSKALADNRGALDTFIVASISGGGIKTLETATRTLIERGQNPEEMARRYNGVANSFRLENVLAFAQQTQASFDTKEYNTLTQASEGLLMRLDRINPNDKVARNDVARELAQVEARRLTMISEILGKSTVDQAMGRTPQQRSAGTTPPQIRPENFAAMQAEIGQAAPERQAPLATAIKILSGAPMQSLTKAEQDAIKPHVAKIGGQTVLTDDILSELSQASPQAAALMQQGSIRDEATRRLEILSTEKEEGGENNENQILQQSPENAGQGIQGYQNAGQDDQGVGKGPLTPGGAAGLPALPPLPVGRGGELISKKEKKVADTLAARLVQGGAEANAAKKFADYFIKRETLKGWGTEKLNAAVAEFRKAGGLQNPQAILASIEASDATQGAEIDSFTSEVLKKLDSDPKAASLTGKDRENIRLVVRNQIAPSLLRFRPIIRGVVAVFDKSGNSDVQVNNSDELIINAAYMLAERGVGFWANTENADLLIDEEVAHISQFKVLAENRRERTGEDGNDSALAFREAEEIFLQLPEQVREASRKIYGEDNLTPAQSGMEFFRQMLQGDIALSEGRVLDTAGNVIAELAIRDRAWIDQVKSVFERLFKVFTDLRGSLGKLMRDEGRSDAEIEEFTTRVEKIRKDSLKFFQNLKKEGDRIRSEAYGQEYARLEESTRNQRGGIPRDAGSVGRSQPPTTPDGRPATTPGGASGQLSPAQSPLGPDQAARLAELESREAERQAREERATERRAEYVAKRAGDLKDYDKVVESTPEDAREPVRELLAQAPSGKAGYVLAVNQRRLPSTWVALPPGVVQTSHIGPTFQKNPEYAGQNTRAYDSDPAEQNKVRAGALPGALNEDILTSTDPSSANSAPQVAIVIDAAPDGQPRARWQAAGGNAREMMSNLAPQEDQDRLSQTWNEKGAQFGFEAIPEGFRGYRFLGVFDIRTTAGASDYQKLVDDLNPATGVVQDVSDRADLDAKNIPLDLVADLPVMMSGKQATEALSRILTAPGNIVERNRIEPMVKNPAQAQAYMQRMMFSAGLGQPKLTSKIADYQLQNRNAAFVEIAADAAKSAIALRQSGSPGIADAFGGLLSNVADYLDQDRSLKSALELAASQIEMDALVGDTAPAVEITKRLVELVVVDKRGRINSDATSEAMKDYMVALASGISRASEDAAMGDIFNEQPMTMAERIAAINAAHRRNAQPDSETTLSAPKNTSARRMRTLELKRRQEGLTRYESDELARLEQSAGQQFMDFFEDTRDQRFELEQEVERRGIERAPVEQMSFVLNAPPSQRRIDAAASIKSPAAVTQQAQQKAPIPAEDDPSRKKFQRFSSAAFQILQDGFKKAVDEDASNGYPGLPGFMPTKGITREERIIEAHFAQQIAIDPQKALEDYIALSKSDFGEEAEGRYLNADLARDVYPPYRNDPSIRPALERATISPAGYIALNLGWNHWLKNTNPAERGTVVFMAGGMASGKTTAVQKSFNSVEKKENAIFLDSVLGNFDRAEQMLAQVEAAGFAPYMAFVFRPFESAAQAAINRLQSTGRPVRLEQLGVAHYDAQKTFLKLYQKYGERIPFDTILNEGSPDDIRREKGVDPLLARAYVNIEDETRTQSATGTETETQGHGRDDLGRATRQPQPRDGRVEGQARGQTPQGPLSALPEAAAKTRLTEYYAELIKSAEISDWEKTAVLYGFIPPAQTTLSAARSSRKASDNQLDFDFSAPAVQDYKAALEADGITHPVAQAAAAQIDLGIPAGPALDLFGEPDPLLEGRRTTPARPAATPAPVAEPATPAHAPAVQPEPAPEVSNDTAPVEQPEPQTDPAAVDRLKTAVGEALRGNTSIDRRVLKNMARTAGITDPEAAAKLVDETAELAVVEVAREIVARGDNPLVTYENLVDLYALQPGLTSRTSTSRINQAFSTPAPLAYVASRLADAANGKSVSEFTAGNGMLVMESSPSRAIVNELDPARAARLRSQGFQVTEADATVARPQRVDTIVMNPPFGTLMQNDGTNKRWTVTVPGGAQFETTQIDHQIVMNQLKSLSADGRAVFIIGGKMGDTQEARADSYNTRQTREFFYFLYKNYNVTDHFTLSGDLYRKQGAAWPIDVLVIEGQGRSSLELPSIVAPAMVKSWDDLRTKIPQTPLARRTFDGERAYVGIDGQPVVDMGRGGPVAELEQPSPVRLGQLGGRAPYPERVGQPGGNPPNASGGQQLSPDSGLVSGGNVGGRDAGSRDGLAEQPDRLVENEEPAEQAGRYQSKYVPQSGSYSVDTLTPTNLASAQKTALKNLEARTKMPVDRFVASKLGFATPEELHRKSDGSDRFSAEAIDALALAINNVENGSSFIIGDQTGIGKGRIAAGMLLYAKKRGFIPVFVTRKPDLYADMIRDISDIGFYDELRPLITNSGQSFEDPRGMRVRTGTSAKHDVILQSLRETGQLPEGTNMVFTTYDQLGKDAPSKYTETKSQKAKRKKDGKARPDGKRAAMMRAIASRAFFVLDESHTGAGADSDIGIRLREWLPASSGVYYSSATFAKNPTAMPLYGQTTMRYAGLSSEELTDAMTSGGVPLQQVVSYMLAVDGQYLRRERSFDGITFGEITVSGENDTQMADQFATAASEMLRMSMDKRFAKALSDFSKLLKQDAATLESNTGESAMASVESYSFAGQMQNLTQQFLLSVKARSTAQNAVQRIRNGEKVVIALQATNQSAIEDIQGHVEWGMNFNGLMRRYVDKIFSARVKRPGMEDSESKSVFDLGAELGVDTSELQAIRQRMIDMLNARDFGTLPLSPIDAMEEIFEEAGVTYGEITARKTGMRGDAIYQRPPKDFNTSAKIQSVKDFNSGSKDILIINAAGSTGISMHAAKNFADQRSRTMLIAQPHLDINEFFQTLGRINRTGQVTLPSFFIVRSELPAERRIAAVLRLRMANLNANTTGAAESNVSENVTGDFLNEYGDQAARSALTNNPEILTKLMTIFPKYYAPRPSQEDREGEAQDMEPGQFIRKLTGHMVVLTIAEQEAMWNSIDAEYASIINYLNETNTNTLQAQSYDYRAKTVEGTVIFQGENAEGSSMFSSPAYLERVEINDPRQPMTLEEAKGLQQAAPEEMERVAGEFREASQNAEEATIARLKSQMQEWNDERDTRYRSRFRQTRELVNRMANYAGRFVQIEMGEETILGIVTGLRTNAQQSGAPSQQSVVISTNTPNRKLTIPLSRVESINFVPSYNNSRMEEQWARPDQARAERVIVTGNILGAYSAFNRMGRSTGRIITFTTENGAVRTGMEMPRSWAETRIVEVRDHGQARQILLDQQKTLTTATGANLRYNTTDRVLVLNIPGDRQRGGLFWRNPELNSIMIGGEFRQTGGNMVANVSPQRLPELVGWFNRNNHTLTHVETPGERTLSAARTQPSPRVRFANAEITPEPTNITLGAARAYHGTPHKVDRFSADKIGTGEGAQAYGWGLYFAENKGVAEQYRKGLTEKDFIRKVRNVFSEFDDWTEQEEALLELPLSEGQRNLLDVLKKEDWWGFDYPHQAVQAALREPENFDTSPELYEALRTFGNTYTVELDVEPEDLLDWDKPLSEQSPKVQTALAEMNPNYRPDSDKYDANELGQMIYTRIQRGFSGNAKVTSEKLLSAGIPGIRYLDGSSRSQGQGTYNYVIFDESLIKILAENGEQVGNAASASTLSAARRQVYDPNQLELDFDAAPRNQVAAQEDAEKSAAARFQSGLDGVMAMASTYSNIPGVDMDEVRQTARIALANAARAFDPQRGVPFGPYSSIVVRNKLNALYRRESLRRERIPQSLDEPLPGDFDETRQDYTPDTATPDAPTMTSRHEARILIDGLIATLPERMRVAVDGYLQQRQQEEIGGYFGISKQAVSRLQQEGFKRLRQKLTERGIGSVTEILSAAQKNPMTGTLGESIGEYGISGAIPLDTDRAMGSIGNRPSAQPSPNTAPVRSLDPGQTRLGIPAEDAFSKISYAPARVWGVRRLAERFEALRNSVGGYPIQSPIYRADYDAHQSAFREAAQAAERLYRDTLERVDAANASRKGTADYLLPRLPEVRALFTDANGQVQMLGSRPAELELGEPLFAASGSPQDDGDFVAPGESFDKDLKNLLNDLNGVPADLDNAVAKQEQAALEEGGGQSYQVGRPDLAFGANNPDVRGLDQFYTERFLPETEAQWETAARDMVAKDFEGTRRSIEQAGLSGQAISPELTKAADQIANTLRQKMLQTGKDADRKAFNVFWYSYRATGTEAGRALAARRDPFKTPAMRHREFLLDLMLTPGKKDKARIDAEPDPAKKTAIIDSVTAALLKKLKDAGISPEDILGNRVVVGLNNAEIQRQFRSGLTPKQAEVFDLLLRKNQTPAQISQRTGMKPDAVEAVFTAFKNRMRQQHLAKFKAGIHKQGETTLGAAPAQSGLFGGQVSDAEAEAAFDQWLSGMVGTSDTKKIGRPKFRIDDPAHVMRLARAIQSARGEAGLGDMAYEWWIMNILSGPQTQVTNIASNAGFLALDSTLQRGMEALVNVFVRDKKAAQLGEFKALARGILPGITKGLAMAAKAWSAEQDFYEHTVLGTPMELGQWDKLGNTSAAIPGQTGRTVRIPGRALLFADSFFKQLSGQMNVAAFAYRMAKAEGLRGQALTTRVAQLSKTRGEIVSENLPSASPSQEMVEYFARQLARRDPSLDPAALMANRSSEAWELAREQAAYDSAKNAGWTEDAWIRAVEKSKEMTFQQDLKRSSEGGNLFEDATAKLQDARFNNKLIGFFFPFVRTPYNIFRTGIRKSPIGAANFAWQAGKGFLAMKDGKAFLDGDPTLVRDMSEQLIAWTAMALIFGAVQGDDDDDDKMLLITGSQPRSEATAGLRDLNTRATGGEYVIRIGGRNGVTIPYGRFDPIATVLGTTTDLIRSIKRNGTTTENLASVWNYMVAQTNSKTFLQGIANISTILEGKSDPVGATKRTVLQALVPNIIRQPLRNLDDYVRDTKSAPATYTLFPSGDLAEPKVDVYGNEIRKGSNPVLRLFFNSALATEPVLDATDRLLMNWNRANPSMAYAPEQAKAVYKGLDGKEVEMTAEEARRFRLASGRLASVKLRAVATPARVAKPTEADIQAIRSAFSDARREVRERMFAGR